MTSATKSWVARTFEIALVLAAAFYALSYLYVALARLTYPYELQWMEGESLVQLWRLLEGQVLYVRPTLSYVPMFYQPLYFYLARLVAEVVGSGFVPLRLVSILASAGCAVVIYVLVKRETSRAWCGWTAVGMWLATFYISGAWFDIGRVDTLLLWWLLLALVLLRRNTCGRDNLFYWATTLGMLAVSFAGRLNPGGYVNNLFPAYAMLSILFGICLGRAATLPLAAVILDVPGWLESDLAPAYELSPEPVFDNERVFWPMTDWRIRPTLWYVPVSR